MASREEVDEYFGDPRMEGSEHPDADKTPGELDQSTVGALIRLIESAGTYFNEMSKMVSLEDGYMSPTVINYGLAAAFIKAAVGELRNIAPDA